MMVVADTGPLHYLVLVGVVEVLPPLYTRVIVPQKVAEELGATGAPLAVQAWIAQPPRWLEIRADPPADSTLALLDPDERAAITLAIPPMRWCSTSYERHGGSTSIHAFLYRHL